MEASDEILAGGEIGAGFAADRGVDLGEQGGGDLNVVDAAHVDGGEEAGEVADDAAAESDEDGGAVGARFSQFRGEAFDLREALEALAGGQEEDGGLPVFGEGGEEFLAPESPDFGRGDDGAACGRLLKVAGNSGEEIAADEDGIIRGGGFDLDGGHTRDQVTGYRL